MKGIAGRRSDPSPALSSHVHPSYSESQTPQAVAKEGAACVQELVKLGVLDGLRPQLESLDRDVQRCAAETLEVLAESDADVAEQMLPRCEMCNRLLQSIV